MQGLQSKSNSLKCDNTMKVREGVRVRVFLRACLCVPVCVSACTCVLVHVRRVANRHIVNAQIYSHAINYRWPNAIDTSHETSQGQPKHNRLVPRFTT